MASPPASAGDPHGTDLGDGRVALRWTHPDVGAVQGICFDVHGARDPLRTLGTAVLTDIVETQGTVGPFEDGGDLYFTVVARQGDALALPSATVRVRVQPVVSPVKLHPGGREGRLPLGLAFPFGVSSAGAVKTQGDAPLLRGKLLQLLLTSPGERVNLPDYGTRLRDLVFDPTNDILLAATEFAIIRALRRWLGAEIQVDTVRIHADEAELSVDVMYLRIADLRSERLRVGVPIPSEG